MESFTMYGFTDYNRKGKVNTLLLKTHEGPFFIYYNLLTQELPTQYKH